MLYRLQKIDTQFDQVEARLNEIDRLLAEDEAVQAARLQLETARSTQEKAHQSLRNVENLVHEQQVKIEQTEANLYSGTGRSPKELQDMQKDIVSLKKRLAVLEDQQIQTMLEAEEVEKAFSETESLFHKTEAQSIEAKSGLAGERLRQLKDLNRLQTERNAALPPILPGNLIIYNRIREQKIGVAVTTVEDDACLLCGAPVRPAESQAARLQSSLHYCISCGRILYAG